MPRPYFSVGLAALVTVLLAAPARSSSTVRVTLAPAVTQLGRPATIAVAARRGVVLFARLGGASTRDGAPARWTRLRFVDGSWRGTLPAPPLRGIYPVQLRDARGGSIHPSRVRFLRVYAGTDTSEPSFADAREVVRWWASSRDADLIAYRPWPLSALDRRDPRLHRLFVIAYRRPSEPTFGTFVTAVRDGYAGRWRLLETTVEPPGVVSRHALG